jgi:alpha-beta hydrolase superfamily lysophospholipase
MDMDATLVNGPGAASLFVRYIVPDAPWAALVLVHGSMVHSEYYLPLALSLAEAGVATFLPDLRGHGRSDGLRAHIAEYRHHVEDALSVLAYVRRSMAVPVHLGGESYGGLIAFLAAATLGAGEAPQSVVLAAPAFALRAQVPPRLRRSLHLVGQAVPALRLPVHMHLTGVSHRADLERLTARDPLLNRQYTIGFFCELLRAQEAAVEAARRLKSPCLALLAGDDRVTDNEATRRVLAAVPRARIVTYPNFLHAVLSEDVPLVSRDLVAFLAGEAGAEAAASAP